MVLNSDWPNIVDRPAISVSQLGWHLPESVIAALERACSSVKIKSSKMVADDSVLRAVRGAGGTS